MSENPNQRFSFREMGAEPNRSRCLWKNGSGNIRQLLPNWRR
jgi:hypothetical protein